MSGCELKVQGGGKFKKGPKFKKNKSNKKAKKIQKKQLKKQKKFSEEYEYSKIARKSVKRTQRKRTQRKRTQRKRTQRKRTQRKRTQRKKRTKRRTLRYMRGGMESEVTMNPAFAEKSKTVVHSSPMAVSQENPGRRTFYSDGPATPPDEPRAVDGSHQASLEDMPEMAKVKKLPEEAQAAAAGGAAAATQYSEKKSEIGNFFDFFQFKKEGQVPQLDEKQEFVNEFDKLIFRIVDIPHLSEGTHTYTIKAFEGGDGLDEDITDEAQPLYSSGRMRWGGSQGIYEYSQTSERVSKGRAQHAGVIASESGELLFPPGRILIVPSLPLKRWRHGEVSTGEAAKRKTQINNWLRVYKLWVEDLKDS